MNKKLFKLMQNRWFYRIMPKWYKFLYCFNVMTINKNGSIHLGNGYSLDFENMQINKL